ncbi:MAG: thioredoxin domain-containing protein, partial [Pseudomonadota bacterium]
MPNRLAAATSPYLLQHQHNPVDWREWGPDALAEAADRDVPILLSVGYAACHWCHVMAHESFENDAIADAMNANFVNVKVDREERPDVDQVFQHALALLGQQGGWPLTMFLTPAGEPFWGGTYFPPDARYGRVGFPDVLATLDRLWRKERDRALGNRDALKDALAALERVADPVALPSDLVAQSAARLAQAFDRSHGGLGGAPKFPQPVLLELLWREGLGSDDRTPATAALVSLEHMARGGIYDHVAGGFARYSVDAEWRVPHFEKMLYDNALLLDLYAEAWARTDRPLYRRTAEGIVAWLLAEMRVDGGFAASLDADSEGEEGRFYVWSADEVRDLLGADADRFAAAFDVRDDGNWEGTNVLNRLTDGDLDDPAHE